MKLRRKPIGEKTSGSGGASSCGQLRDDEYDKPETMEAELRPGSAGKRALARRHSCAAEARIARLTVIR